MSAGRSGVVTERVFRALADGSRLRIIEILHGSGPMAIQDLCAHFPVSRFAVMKHLNVLEAAGIVRRVREGNSKQLHLETEPLRLAWDAWLSRYAHPKQFR